MTPMAKPCPPSTRREIPDLQGAQLPRPAVPFMT